MPQRHQDAAEEVKEDPAVEREAEAEVGADQLVGVVSHQGQADPVSQEHKPDIEPARPSAGEDVELHQAHPDQHPAAGQPEAAQ